MQLSTCKYNSYNINVKIISQSQVRWPRSTDWQRKNRSNKLRKLFLVNDVKTEDAIKQLTIKLNFNH